MINVQKKRNLWITNDTVIMFDGYSGSSCNARSDRAGAPTDSLIFSTSVGLVTVISKAHLHNFNSKFSYKCKHKKLRNIMMKSMTTKQAVDHNLCTF